MLSTTVAGVCLIQSTSRLSRFVGFATAERGRPAGTGLTASILCGEAPAGTNVARISTASTPRGNRSMLSPIRFTSFRPQRMCAELVIGALIGARERGQFQRTGRSGVCRFGETDGDRGKTTVGPVPLNHKHGLCAPLQRKTARARRRIRKRYGTSKKDLYETTSISPRHPQI